MRKKLKGAVAGYGFIASRGHIPAYLHRISVDDDLEIIAVQDICEERRQLAKKVLPKATLYSNYAELLEKENLDFIDIAAPPSEHFKMAAAALEKGFHVLCEKPLTTSTADAVALLKLARQKKRVIFPCHNYKHAPVIKAIGEVVESGRIGKVRSVTLSTFRNTHAKGVPEWETNWRRFKKWSGGGIAMDHGSHSFYLAFDWLKGYPTAVTAKMTCAQKEKYDTEDNFSCVLTFPSGLAHMHLTWTAGMRKVIYTLQGEKGAIKVEDDNLEVSLMRATNSEDVAQGNVAWEVEKRTISSDWMDASHVSWFNSLFDEFKKAIEENDYTGKQAEEAFKCVQLINAAYTSANENCREIILSRVDENKGEEHLNGITKVAAL